MKLIHANRFIFLCTWTERKIPQEAHFVWDASLKEWYTTNIKTAARLRNYADENAKNKIDSFLLVRTPWMGRVDYPKKLIPKPYQIEDARFALSQNRTYLALEPGLGKTIIAALVARNLNFERTIYVCPPSLTNTVKFEFEKWEAIGDLNQFDIVPDSKLHEFEREMQSFPKNILLIIDEAHRFKNEKTQRAKALFKLARYCNHVLLLSGTPMPNRPIELYSILSNFAPETINFFNRFDYGIMFCAGHRTRWGWDFSGASNIQILSQQIKEKFIRVRKKSEVLKELPEKLEEIILIGDDLPKKLLNIDASLLKIYSPKDLMKSKILAEHIATYRKELGRIKVQPSLKFIHEILEDTDESILVFAYHKDVIAELEKGLSQYQPLVITGATPTKSRKEIVDTFQNAGDKRRVFIGQIDACGLGFTLTKATRVLFVEFSWVPGANDQAADRAHRIGQRDSVLVQYLVFKNSIDRKIIEACLNKTHDINHI